MNGTATPPPLPIPPRLIPRDWLEERNRLTSSLYDCPYDLILYLKRAKAYSNLGYHDLAAGDAYRALLLVDEAREESGEWHEEAWEVVRGHCITGEEKDEEVEERVRKWVDGVAVRCYRVLASSLAKCGCLRTAWEFCKRGLKASPRDLELLEEQQRIIARGKRLQRRDSQSKVPAPSSEDSNDSNGNRHARSSKEPNPTPPFDPTTLPTNGFARRELYPWNPHEPDRFSPSTLAFLNSELSTVAPKLCVRATTLPYLDADPSHPALDRPPRRQLGLFALEDIAPGEMALMEASALTVNSRLHASLCDCCSSRLPDLTTDPESAQQITTCPECDDIFFCGETCFERARETYHPAVCGLDLESIGKEGVSTNRKEAPEVLYTLLLARAFAMSLTQNTHPLDLKEVKYIWGDFNPIEIQHPSPTSEHPPTPAEAAQAEETLYDTHAATHLLPFSFHHTIASPLHILEKMDINPFTTLSSLSDPWLHQTLLSKFRATASARLSEVDGSPEVAAVHPLWCLANHSCDPNVMWEWGGEIRFWGRGERVRWRGAEGETTVDGSGERVEGARREAGIRKGEEVWSHYCDVELGVRERREWAIGSLGGWCVCERCVWEEGELLKMEERVREKEREGEGKMALERDRAGEKEVSGVMNAVEKMA